MDRTREDAIQRLLGFGCLDRRELYEQLDGIPRPEHLPLVDSRRNTVLRQYLKTGRSDLTFERSRSLVKDYDCFLSTVRRIEPTMLVPILRFEFLQGFPVRWIRHRIVASVLQPNLSEDCTCASAR